MGVEHYLVCGQCKEYIDLHKSYEFGMIINKDHPPVGVDCAETDFNDVVLRGGYWESRGLWFLWHHRGHKDIELWTDSNDEWFDLEPNLIEKYSHDEMEKIRNEPKP